MNKRVEINSQKLLLSAVISCILFSVKNLSTFEDVPNPDALNRKAETSVQKQGKRLQAVYKPDNSSAGSQSSLKND